jgi:hypothetical protein
VRLCRQAGLQLRHRLVHRATRSAVGSSVAGRTPLIIKPIAAPTRARTATLSCGPLFGPTMSPAIKVRSGSSGQTPTRSLRLPRATSVPEGQGVAGDQPPRPRSAYSPASSSLFQLLRRVRRPPPRQRQESSVAAEVTRSFYWLLGAWFASRDAISLEAAQ